MFFFFGALPIDQSKIKHTKKLKKIPSRHFLENLLEKSKHLCLYTSETHWQFTGILPIYNGRHAKSYNSRLQKIFRNRFSRPLKLIFFKFSQFSINPHIHILYIYAGWHKVGEPGIRDPRQRRISSIAKTPNIRCFVVKLHLSRFTRFFRGDIPIL